MKKQGFFIYVKSLAPNDIQWVFNNYQLFTPCPDGLTIKLHLVSLRLISFPSLLAAGQQTGTSGGDSRKCCGHTQKMSLCRISRGHEGWRLARSGSACPESEASLLFRTSLSPLQGRTRECLQAQLWSSLLLMLRVLAFPNKE